VVAVAVDHRKARVRGLDDERDELRPAVVDVDHVHLRARDHQVARLHSETCSTPSIIDSASASSRLRSCAECSSLDQLVAVLGLAHQQRRQALEQGRLGSCRMPAGVLSDGSEYRVALRRHTGVGSKPSRARIAARAPPSRARRGAPSRGRGPARAACRAPPGARSGPRGGLPCSRASRRTTGTHSTMSPHDGRARVVEGQHVGGVVLAAVVAVQPRPSAAPTKRSVISPARSSAARTQRASVARAGRCARSASCPGPAQLQGDQLRRRRAAIVSRRRRSRGPRRPS
jgi:hypothetical protein